MKKKFGVPPNIIQVMRNDTSLVDAGIPAISKTIDFLTERINQITKKADSQKSR